MPPGVGGSLKKEGLIFIKDLSGLQRSQPKASVSYSDLIQLSIQMDFNNIMKLNCNFFPWILLTKYQNICFLKRCHSSCFRIAPWIAFPYWFINLAAFLIICFSVILIFLSILNQLLLFRPCSGSSKTITVLIWHPYTGLHFKDIFLRY